MNPKAPRTPVTELGKERQLFTFANTCVNERDEDGIVCKMADK